MKKSIIFGTAGHIDHGKSSLVLALTGTDPDRLKEEKEKGITIELGYAGLDTDDLMISFVDVPGHEKFVRTMISGSVGFDAVLFCVDGHEGIMPQTLEHFSIIRTVGVKRAVAAVTKADKCTPDELEKTADSLKKLFDGSGIALDDMITVSIYDKESLNRLRQAVISCAEKTEPKTQARCYVMRADRVFSMKGHGTVVTGTSLFGTVTDDTTIFNILNGKKARVKNIQVHGHDEAASVAGQRTALNLPDLTVGDIKKGDLLTENGRMLSTKAIYARIEVFGEIGDTSGIKSNSTYPLIIGSETYEGKLIIYGEKKLAHGTGGFCLIRLDRPAVVFFDEPFIIRASGPQKSVAGGRVLALEETFPDRKTAKPILEALAAKEWKKAVILMTETYHCGLKIPEPIQFSGLLRAELNDLFEKTGLTMTDGFVIRKALIDEHVADVLGKLQEKGSIPMNRMDKGCEILPEKLRAQIQNTIIEEARKLDYIFDGHMLKLKKKDPFEQAAMNVLNSMKKDPSLSNAALIAEKLDMPEDMASKCLAYLCNRSLARRVEGSTHVTMDLINSFIEKAAAEAKKQDGIDLSRMRQLFDLPRKLLVPLMEQLDTTGIFINRDNKRYLK